MTQTTKRLHDPVNTDSFWIYALAGIGVTVAMIFGAGFFFGMVACG